MSSSIESVWLGEVEYAKALELQSLAWGKTKSDGVIRLLGLEHPTVITLGVRSQESEDLSFAEEKSPTVFRIDRGGQATLHSPGQLVIYPMISLEKRGLTPRAVVRLVEDVSLQVLADLGIRAERGEQAGLYVGTKKIGFVGMRIDRRVTRHGLSLNVNNDLSLFRHIRPCGVQGQALTSVQNEGVGFSDCRQIFQLWTKAFDTGLRSFAQSWLDNPGSFVSTHPEYKLETMVNLGQGEA